MDRADNRSHYASQSRVVYLGVGQSLQSPDNRFVLVMQSDANLVIYGPSGAL
jgi:hypothetical protein